LGEDMSKGKLVKLHTLFMCLVEECYIGNP
jgi:hypothetical protein